MTNQYQTQVLWQHEGSSHDTAANQREQIISKSVPKTQIATVHLNKGSASQQILQDRTPSLHTAIPKPLEQDRNDLDHGPSQANRDNGMASGLSNIGSAILKSQHSLKLLNSQQNSKNREVIQQIIKRQKERINIMDSKGIHGIPPPSSQQAIKRVVDTQEPENTASLTGRAHIKA